MSACLLKIAHRFALRGRVVVDAFNAEIIALDPSLEGNMLVAGAAAGGAFDFWARKVKPTVTELAPLTSSRSMPTAWSSADSSMDFSGVDVFVSLSAPCNMRSISASSSRLTPFVDVESFDMRPVNALSSRATPPRPLTGRVGSGGNCDRTDAGIGTSLPKFVTAESPRIARAAASYASAASSAESNVPNHNRDPRVGSRISAAYLPHGRCLTPLYTLFCGFPLEFNDGDAAAADVGMDATATAAAVASFTATLAISIFFTLDALVGGFCTPPDFTDGDEEKCAIAARGGSLRLAGGLNALNPLFGDPM